MQISHSIHDYFSHAPTCFRTFSSDVSLFYLLKPSLQISRWSIMIEMAQFFLILWQNQNLNTCIGIALLIYWLRIKFPFFSLLNEDFIYLFNFLIFYRLIVREDQEVRLELEQKSLLKKKHMVISVKDPTGKSSYEKRSIGLQNRLPNY